MTTFSVVGSWHKDTQQNPDVALSGLTAGNYIIACFSQWRGSYTADHTISDTNTGSWTKLEGHDSEMGNSSYRHSMSIWGRLVTSTDASSGPTITCVGPSNDSCALTVFEVEASASFDYTFEDAVSGTSGTADWDGTSSGNTSSISGGNDILEVAVGFGRITDATTDPTGAGLYFDTQTDDKTSYIQTLEMAHVYAIEASGQADGVKSATINADGSGYPGITAVLAFSTAGGGTTITGSGAISALVPTLSGSGTIARNGTGAATLPIATLFGTGVREIVGSGGITAPIATLDGSGTVGAVVTGSGAATLPVATIDGTGLREITGTGSATLPSVTISGTGLREITGSGGVTSPLPTLAGTGEIAGAISGSGAITAPAVTASGTGLREITGSGGVSAPVPTLDGTGELSGIVGGSGGVTAPSVTISGAGTIARDGAGAITAPIVTLSGTGTVEELQPGTGAVVIPLPSLSGAGVRASVGSGTATLPVAVLAGTGIRTAVGTGAITLPVVTLYGVQVVGGIRVERVGGDSPGGTLSASANNGILTSAREAV